MTLERIEPHEVEDTGQVPASLVSSLLLKSGLRIFHGRLTEEYLPELRPWAKAARIYLEMKDDAVVGSLLDAIEAPILSTEFQVTPAQDTPEDKAAAKFLEKCLFEMEDMEWKEHVEEAIEFLAFGFSLHEIVMEKKGDGKIYLRSLLPIGAETIRDWGTELDALGNFQVVTQQHPLTGDILSAPRQKLIHFTFRKRKRNPEGKSLLRSVYRPWFFKKNLEVIEAIGAERDVGNVPILDLPEDKFVSPEDLAELSNKLANFRADEASYMVVPSGMKLSAYQGGSKAFNIRGIIRDYQNIIRQRFFAGFIAQGTEQVGTQALARELTSFFSLIARSIQTRMLDVWRRQLIPYIFKYNQFGINELPHLDWKAPGKENIQSISQAVTGLIDAKILTPSEDIEDYMRNTMGFPPLPDGTPRAWEKRDEIEQMEAMAPKIIGDPNMVPQKAGFPGKPKQAPPKQQGLDNPRIEA